MKDVEITKKQMDERLKTDKGWICNHSGNEYIYDFHLSKFPIIVKVMSSISIDNNRNRNKGSDTIRVFAVVKDKMEVKDYKVISGLVKSMRVNRTTNWGKNVEKAVMLVMDKAKKNYNKYRR